MAEFWAIKTALAMAWNEGCCRVIIESESLKVIDMTHIAEQHVLMNGNELIQIQD